MSRFNFAISLAGALCCLIALAGSKPNGQEKQPPANANKPATQGEKDLPNRGFSGLKPPRAKAADVANRNQAFLQNFKNLHKHELHFMRVVCQPSREQFEKVAADSETALVEVRQQFADLQEDRRIWVRGGSVIGKEDVPEPSGQVAAVVAKSVRKILPTQLADRYDRELSERLQESRRTQVQCFVGQMDTLLHLSPDQREALVKLLLSKWSYSPSRTTLLDSSNQCYPLMPDAEINPILTDSQRQLWAGVRKGVGTQARIEFGPDVDFEEMWQRRDSKTTVPSSKTDDKQNSRDKKERR